MSPPRKKRIPTSILHLFIVLKKNNGAAKTSTRRKNLSKCKTFVQQNCCQKQSKNHRPQNGKKSKWISGKSECTYEMNAVQYVASNAAFYQIKLKTWVIQCCNKYFVFSLIVQKIILLKLANIFEKDAKFLRTISITISSVNILSFSIAALLASISFFSSFLSLFLSLFCVKLPNVSYSLSRCEDTIIRVDIPGDGVKVQQKYN